MSQRRWLTLHARVHSVGWIHISGTEAARGCSATEISEGFCCHLPRHSLSGQAQEKKPSDHNHTISKIRIRIKSVPEDVLKSNKTILKVAFLILCSPRNLPHTHKPLMYYWILNHVLKSKLLICTNNGRKVLTKIQLCYTVWTKLKYLDFDPQPHKKVKYI